MSRLPVHQFDPNRAPDSDFEGGALELLVAGNRARMLDPRRTPVLITGVREPIGQFECEVLDFEDRGSRWLLPLESVAHFQFARGSARSGGAAAGSLEAAVKRFAAPLEIGCDWTARPRTLERLAGLEREAADWLRQKSRFVAAGETFDFTSRRGEAALWRDLSEYWPTNDLRTMDDRFATTYVSHPLSREIVKGHQIVLVELGLSSYRGLILRDPTLLEGAWGRELRAEHVLRRMAFVRALYQRLGLEHVRLYRGFAGEQVDPGRRAVGFISASFAREVAESMLGPAETERAGRVRDELVPVRQLFMTFLETAAMNRPFEEAEALMIVDPQHPAFDGI